MGVSVSEDTVVVSAVSGSGSGQPFTRKLEGFQIMDKDETIKKLERKIKRLEKRLLTKKKYDTMDLEQRGATPQFIAQIDAKDAEAMSD